MKEILAQKKNRAAEILKRLYGHYPNPKGSLSYSSAHELLVATILSAQCTDKRVNLITPTLFEKYTSPNDFANADIAELAKDIHSCGYHNQKARSIIACSQMIVNDFNGDIPDSLESLIKLPGVGRKTANCVLGQWFGIPAMVIDTHMIRIMNVLELTQSESPNVIEKEMMELFEPMDWVSLTHMIIAHGRAVCVARRPDCQNCFLLDICPFPQRKHSYKTQK